MDSFGYSRCAQCDEEHFVVDGFRCARCLGLSYVPDDEDNEEESPSISPDRLAAAQYPDRGHRPATRRTSNVATVTTGRLLVARTPTR